MDYTSIWLHSLISFVNLVIIAIILPLHPAARPVLAHIGVLAYDLEPRDVP